jgi:hypothetical protein
MTRVRAGAMIALCAGLTMAGRMTASQTGLIDQFTARVQAYMEFRSDFTDMVPPLRVTPDAAVLEAASDGLAGALRAARPHARQGDIFTAEIAAAFRDRIADALWRHRYPAPELLADIEREAPQPSTHFAVNDRFEWSYGAMMPGCLLGALPALPTELQYRFVGVDLVLVDIEARLVVDVLPLALHVD